MRYAIAILVTCLSFRPGFHQADARSQRVFPGPVDGDECGWKTEGFRSINPTTEPSIMRWCWIWRVPGHIMTTSRFRGMRYRWRRIRATFSSTRRSGT